MRDLGDDGGMTALDAARTPRRAFWGDARFLLGVLLIVASVAGVWFVVSAARQTAPAFAATRTIVPGEAITSDDVVFVCEVGQRSAVAAELAAAAGKQHVFNLEGGMQAWRNAGLPTET